ncbi:MAG: hypothetical protein H7840_12615 [Alphaproteobacteria bacterium]
MQGLSERQYAAHAGISRGAVQKARTAERLVLFPDGSIDAHGSDARRAAMTDPAKQRPRPAPRSAEPPSAPSSSLTSALQATAAPRGGPHDSSVATAPASPEQFFRAKTANEVVRAQIGNLRLQRLRGELIDRSKAVALVFKLARQERDAWQNFSGRVCAEMAAELGIDAVKLQAALEKYVRRQLSELAEIRPNFR